MDINLTNRARLKSLIRNDVAGVRMENKIADLKDLQRDKNEVIEAIESMKQHIKEITRALEQMVVSAQTVAKMNSSFDLHLENTSPTQDIENDKDIIHELHENVEANTSFHSSDEVAGRRVVDDIDYEQGECSTNNSDCQSNDETPECNSYPLEPNDANCTYNFRDITDDLTNDDSDSDTSVQDQNHSSDIDSVEAECVIAPEKQNTTVCKVIKPSQSTDDCAPNSKIVASESDLSTNKDKRFDRPFNELEEYSESSNGKKGQDCLTDGAVSGKTLSSMVPVHRYASKRRSDNNMHTTNVPSVRRSCALVRYASMINLVFFNMCISCYFRQHPIGYLTQLVDRKDFNRFKACAFTLTRVYIRKSRSVSKRRINFQFRLDFISMNCLTHSSFDAKIEVAVQCQRRIRICFIVAESNVASMVRVLESSKNKSVYKSMESSATYYSKTRRFGYHTRYTEHGLICNEMAIIRSVSPYLEKTPIGPCFGGKHHSSEDRAHVMHYDAARDTVGMIEGKSPSSKSVNVYATKVTADTLSFSHLIDIYWYKALSAVARSESICSTYEVQTNILSTSIILDTTELSIDTDKRNEMDLRKKEDYNDVNEVTGTCLAKLEKTAELYRHLYFEQEQHMICNGFVYPIQEMQDLQFRRRSFFCYRGDGNRDELAEHGFYHCPNINAKSTKCFACLIIYDGWTTNCNVSEVHKRLSPTCRLHIERRTGYQPVHDPCNAEYGATNYSPRAWALENNLAHFIDLRAGRERGTDATPSSAISLAVERTRGYTVDLHRTRAPQADHDELDIRPVVIMCHGCNSQPANIVLLPCRHLVICDRCVVGFIRCPACNTRNVGHVRAVVFW
ncbi:uncharacterized protein LOC127853564 isoform X2 [Dreissena polymorpha]|uniref:RING-type domain-containing protein n=1 Tax=Dreissena polymorpha TaxID=45954 RepID=A0A9D4HU21_DREPO|nr:uncharacterized protein LOC127853564 isoform X2 [Dreissena polymorpha]KAH3729433.1 hypothetical protein DPMN_055404 [Dreissena polymorpha]